MFASVVITFDDEPGGGITDAQVEDDAASNEGVEGGHELRNRGCIIKEMNVILFKSVSARIRLRLNQNSQGRCMRCVDS